MCSQGGREQLGRTHDKADRTFKTPLLLWHKGQIRPAAQREIARLLEKPIESRIFDALPTPTLTESPVDHVCWVRRWDRCKPFFLFVPDWRPYRVEDAYEEARTQSDGQYSPHTAFRSVSHVSVVDAIDFVNEFGPLELLDESPASRQPLRPEDLLDFDDVLSGDPRERCVWVDVEDFWQKHRRFCTVVRLWELRESPKAMLSALSEVAALSVYPDIGARREGESYTPSSIFPWKDGYFNEWVRKAKDKQLMDASAEIIKSELSLNTDRMRLSWRCPSPSQLQFQLVPYATSLWSAIWHLFARDTSQGLGWRICRHCSKLFYPKRKDSYFCESRYQKLHAASQWWHEHKETELEKRRKERTMRSTARKQTARKSSADRRG